MSDHLTRLAARALGLAETVRPRRTLYEPQRVTPEPVPSPEPEAQPPPEAPATRAEEAREPPPAAVTRREEPAPREVIEQVVAKEPEQVLPPPVETPEPEPAPARPQPAPSRPVQARRRETAPARPEPVAQPPAAAPSKLVGKPQPLLASRPPYRLLGPERELPQAPTVRVTIGRVDVRAVAPERPVERRLKQPRRMSLDEYLSRSRSGAQ
jgi:hypothetical protein